MESTKITSKGFDLSPSPEVYERHEVNQARQAEYQAWSDLESPIYEAIANFGLGPTLKAIAQLVSDGARFGDLDDRYGLPEQYCLIKFGGHQEATENSQELSQLKG